MTKIELLVAVGSLPESDPKIEALAAVLSGSGAPDRPASFKLLTFGAFAKELGVSRPTVFRMARENLLKTVEVRKGSRRIPETEIMRLVGGK